MSKTSHLLSLPFCRTTARNTNFTFFLTSFTFQVKNHLFTISSYLMHSTCFLISYFFLSIPHSNMHTVTWAMPDVRQHHQLTSFRSTSHIFSIFRSLSAFFFLFCICWATLCIVSHRFVARFCLQYHHRSVLLPALVTNTIKHTAKPIDRESKFHIFWSREFATNLE